MIATPDEILRAFSELSSNEQKQVSVEILRRAPWLTEGVRATNVKIADLVDDDEDLSGAALDEMADELFRVYDAEESAHAKT